MIQSSQPRKQRKFRFNAPMHLRQHFLRVHLDKAVREKLKIRKRAVQVSEGDTVKVMHGAKRGTSGKVLTVSLRSGKITIDSLKRKTAKGKEYHIPVYASNVYITDLNLTDKVRAKKLNVAVQAAQKPQQAKTELASQMKPQVQKPVEISGEVPAQAISK